MTRKRALVVDDSKTARASMQNMLEAFDLEVDTAASAEDALEYLRTNRPQVVFMDHMMPGMDGLQAVKEIKNDPTTAMIPVMMYTSKGEGEVYVGQARALGAMGVVPKEVQQADLRKVLQQLHLLPGQTDTRSMPAIDLDDKPALAAEQPAAVRPISTSGLSSNQASSAAGNAGYARPQLRASVASNKLSSSSKVRSLDLKAVLRRLLREQRAGIRKDLVRVSDLVADKLVVRLGDSSSSRDPLPAAALDDPRQAWLVGGLLGVAVLAVAVLGALAWTFTEFRALQQSKLELAIDLANFETQRAAALSNDGTIPSSSEGSGFLALLEQSTDNNSQDQQRYLESIQWALNSNSAVPYGEPILSEARVPMLRGLLSRLASVGFVGSIRMDVHLGNFCVTSQGPSYSLPEPGTLIGECEILELDSTTAVQVGEEQTIGFANFISNSPLLGPNLIELEIISHGTSQPLVDYPSINTVQTGGEWNEIAARNNRLEISLQPASF